MGDRIHIQMMDKFAIYINEQQRAQMLNNSKKGLELIAFLILNQNRPVLNQKLLSTLWPDENSSSNPATALKTLISRTRATLNKISEGFGNCIVADRGAYHWEMLPGMTVDVCRIEEILNGLAVYREDAEEYGRQIEQMLELYAGDLLQDCEPSEWAVRRAAKIQSSVLEAVDQYVKLLLEKKEYDNAIRICRQALDIDNFNEQFHMYLMKALIETNRNTEALTQYKHATHLQYRYFGVQPSEDMQEFYKQIVNAGRTLEFNLEAIQNELIESENQPGAFVCEYAVFKEIFNLQIRNLRRLQTTMFLAVIMVSDIKGEALDSMRQAGIMNGLMEILKTNLRKGDAITHYSPTMLALLLPTADYKTAGMVMERIKKIFYSQYPVSEVKFDYRVGPLRSASASPDHRGTS